MAVRVGVAVAVTPAILVAVAVDVEVATAGGLSPLPPHATAMQATAAVITDRSHEAILSRVIALLPYSAKRNALHHSLGRCLLSQKRPIDGANKLINRHRTVGIDVQ